jgi:hypothetical protein
MHAAVCAVALGVFLLPLPSLAIVALTNANIAAAVISWTLKPFTTASMYGPITSWDTSAVSSMYQLFANRPSFNENIGGWNVARVANMAVRSACSHRAARVFGARMQALMRLLQL